MREDLDTFVRSMRALDRSLEAVDLLDALWLARRIEIEAPGTRANQEARARAARPTAGAPDPPRSPESAPRSTPAGPATAPDPPPTAKRPGELSIDLPYRGGFARDAEPRAGGGATRVRGRGASPLSDRLAFQRALRPLKIALPSKRSMELDERRTADRSAERGLLVPVLRPVRERGTELDVVIDVAPSMVVWHATLRRFKRLLLRSGVFRRTTFWSWDTQRDPAASRLGYDWPARGPCDRPPSALGAAAGRSIVFVITDAVGDGWYDRGPLLALHDWARRAEVVLLPTLPGRLWGRTGLRHAEPVLIPPSARGIVGGDRPALPRRPARLFRRSGPGRPRRRISIEQWRDRRPAVPITGLQPESFARLARFLAGHGSSAVAGVCLPWPRSIETTSATPSAEPADPLERLRAFRAHASPAGRQLARCLAAPGYFSLEILRLIRERMVPDATLAEEAELLFSGITTILRPDPDPERVVYGFDDAVRTALRDELTVQMSFQVLRRAFGFWSSAAGFGDVSLDLLVRRPDERERITAEGPLARIAAEVLADLVPVETTVRTSEAPTDRAERPGAKRPPKPPRVQLSHATEVDSFKQEMELPFVIGVLADLVGDSFEEPVPLADRSFLEIDLDTFDDRLAALRPGLRLRVPNTMLEDEDAQLAVDLRFGSMDDFRPDAVARQVPPLAILLDIRVALASMRSLLDRRPHLLPIIDRGLTEHLESERAREGKGAPSFEPSADWSTVAGEISEPSAGGLETPDDRDAPLSILLNELAFEHDTGVDPHVLRLALGAMVETTRRRGSGRPLPGRIEDAMIELDETLSRQLRPIVHHPEFQRLEGTWRGLRLLVDRVDPGANVRVRVLQATRAELAADVEASSVAMDGVLAKHLVGTLTVLGGEPYGALIVDLEFDSKPRDVDLLRSLATVAEAAHCPVIASASPALLGLESFGDLHRPRDLTRHLEGPAMAPWREFRDRPEARYVALTMPRVMARLPHDADDPDPTLSFRFREMPDGEGDRSDDEGCCWSSAAWAYGAVLARSFAVRGLCDRTRGADGGGLVEGLPTHTFRTVDGDVAMKCPTEVAIKARDEIELSRLGLLPFVHARNTDSAVFFSDRSVHRPPIYDDDEVTEAADRASRLSNVFVLSRFAHYLRAIARDRLGRPESPEQVRDVLRAWLMTYVDDDPEASAEVRARRPLRAADVWLVEQVAAGVTAVEVSISPWLRLDEASPAMTLRLDLPASDPPTA